MKFVNLDSRSRTATEAKDNVYDATFTYLDDFFDKTYLTDYFLDRSPSTTKSNDNITPSSSLRQ
jgi:hypothetical protein